MSKLSQVIDIKNQKRESSNTSKGSKSNKFLKRKPDAKKIIFGVASKNRRQMQNNDYFNEEIHSERPNNNDSFSECKPESEKYISLNNDLKGNSNFINDNSIKTLETVKSDSSLLGRLKQGARTPPKNRVSNKLLKVIAKNQEINSSLNSKRSDLQQITGVDSSNSLLQNKMNVKKSRTQYFFYDQVENSGKKTDIMCTQDDYDMSETRKKGEIFKSQRNIQNEYESLLKKNKWLHEQNELLMEKQYLLQTEQKHLEQINKEKDKIIDRLTRQKNLLSSKIKGEIETDSQLKSQLQSLKSEFQKQKYRSMYIKEENVFLQNQLLYKNQELITAYNKNSELQHTIKHEQKRFREKLQAMKQSVQKAKIQSKQQILEFDSYGQMQILRQKLVQLQQELKYVKIQNQCLLISKQELLKSQQENKKLKEERDYFKKKVVQHVRRKRSSLNSISQSGGSILFQLSECSIDP